MTGKRRFAMAVYSPDSRRRYLQVDSGSQFSIPAAVRGIARSSG